MRKALDYLIDSLVNVVIALFTDFKELFMDLGFWAVEQVLGAMAWAIGLVADELPTMDTTGMWVGTPDQILQVLTYLDFHVCIAIVTGAMVIRFGLNFIPFIK